MLVTAAITTHNREPSMVERALKSILNQTHKELEVIVVDDSNNDFAERDAVRAMAESYPGVTYIKHEVCQGACAARNSALEIAKGEFIGYLDDDDEWLPEKIEKQLQGFTSENIALVYCDAESMNDDTGEITPENRVMKSGQLFVDLLSRNFIGSTSFPLLRTSALREVGGFDILMESAQDYDVWLRLAKLYEINYAAEILVRYHIHGTDRISTVSSKKINGLKRLNEKNYDELLKYPDAFWKRYMILAFYYAKAKDKKTALALWWKAVCKKPFAIIGNIKYLYRIIRYGS